MEFDREYACTSQLKVLILKKQTSPVSACFPTPFLSRVFWFCSHNQEQLSKSFALLVESPKIITTAPQCMRDHSVRYQIRLLGRV